MAARRTRVLDAVLDLALEGHVRVKPSLAAERAGISEATLWRYFDNLDELRAAVLERSTERFADLLAISDLGLGLCERRVAALVDKRLDQYEQIGAVARLFRSHIYLSDAAASAVDAARRGWVEQVRAQFAPELAGRSPQQADDVVALVAVLVSYESWEHLSRSLGRSRADITRLWAGAIRSALATAEPAAHLPSGGAGTTVVGR